MSKRNRIPTRQLPDSLLVDLIADGDADAFALMTQRYGGQMRSIALRYTRNNADADDVIQEALVTAWQQIKTLKDSTALRPWLMRLTARKAIDLVRRRKDEATLEDDAHTASGIDESVIQRAGIAQALAKLPAAQAQVWVLRYGAQLSYQEIADELDTNIATVRGRLARAKKTMLAQMEGWE